MSDWNRMRRGNPRTVISTGFVLVALILYVLARWDSGLLGDLWGVATDAPATTVAVDNSTPTAAPTHAATATLAPTATVAPAAVAPTNTAEANPVETATATPKPSPTANAPPTPTRASKLAVVYYDELPPEAQDTLALIDQGGPFPFRQDGTVFQNREGILPPKANGYYHEYTVITPGLDNRGPRRIVGGGDGELFYTDDHYASFREIIR